MNYPVIFLLASMALAACQTPRNMDAAPAEECIRSHRLGDLSIALSCNWKIEGPKGSPTELYWIRNSGNTVLLQNGNINRPSGAFDLDSSLTATFKERRVPGMIDSIRNGKFIHGMKELGAGKGDSLYIYMEDTVTWSYYHFDGQFKNDDLREQFLGALRDSELVR